MNKSFSYYQNTIQLKTRAVFFRFADKYGLLHQVFKNENLARINKSFQLKEVVSTCDYLTYDYYDSIASISQNLYCFPNEKLYLSSKIGKFKGVYSPIYPALYCLVSLDRLIRNKETVDLDSIYKHLNYLMDHCSYDERNGLLRLSHNFSFEYYDLKPGWINGLTQSIASSVFIRMWKLTEDEVYLNYSKACLDTMLLDINEGGCSTHFKGLPIIEEYPSPGGSYVLNGFISAIIGLLDFMSFTRQVERYELKANILIETLLTILQYYVYKKDILYCLKHRNLSNIYYQALHVFQFKHLYILTKDPRFLTIQNELNHVNWRLFTNVYRTSSLKEIEDQLALN